VAESAKKRRVKNPETFREKAIKATEAGEKTSRSSKVKNRSGKALGSVFGPVGRVLGPVLRLKPFRIIGRILLPGYLRNSWAELRQVKWPTLAESRRLTVAVLIFAALFGAAIAVVDYGLDKLFRNILLK
jgi:preprotein translocase SecE subunit